MVILISSLSMKGSLLKCEITSTQLHQQLLYKHKNYNLYNCRYDIGYISTYFTISLCIYSMIHI